MNRRTFAARVGIGAAVAAAHPLTAEPQEQQWPRDGVGSLARFGVLTPDFDPVPESEMWAMAPPGISIHTARVRRTSREPRAFADPPHVDDATDELTALNLRAILFAYTSSSYALGAVEEDNVRVRLERRSDGIPVILTCQAALAALRSLNLQRLSLIHPPWFSDAVNDQGASYFRSHGFDVVQYRRLEPARTFTEVTPAELLSFVSSNTPREAEAVFIGGNGLRTAGAIAALERRLGRPVIAANQVLMWAALRRSGIPVAVNDYGQLYRR